MQGQGSLEYLLLIGGAVVTAAVIVSMLLGLSLITSSVTESNAQTLELQKLSALKGVDLMQTRSFYLFENSAGDLSGHKLNGTTVGTLTYTNGRSGSGLDFPGTTSDYISLNNGAANGLSDFTIMMWIKTSRTGEQALISGSESNAFDNELLLHIYNPTSVQVVVNSSGAWYTVPNLATGTWRNIAWTRSADQSTLYVDCTSVGPSQPVSNLAVSIAPSGLVLGEEQDSVGGAFQSDQVFDGVMDEVWIVGRALPQNEIQKLAGC